MIKRSILIVLLLICAALATVLLRQNDGSIALTGAQAMQMTDDVFMIGLTIDNSGDPDVLLGARMDGAASVSIMNPDALGLPLVVPAQSQGILAGDGAHIMLMAPDVAFTEGAILPLTLVFERAGEVVTRVQHAGMGGMQHMQGAGVDEVPSPSVTLTLPDGPRADGFDLRLAVQNFTFVRTPADIDMAAHVAGEGHAHLYLNGLKLGRLYGPEANVGPLPPGIYDLRVSLNTNDHRSYMNGDVPVQSVVSFTLE